jgi:hypothetical protein
MYPSSEPTPMLAFGCIISLHQRDLWNWRPEVCPSHPLTSAKDRAARHQQPSPAPHGLPRASRNARSPHVATGQFSSHHNAFHVDRRLPLALLRPNGTVPSVRSDACKMPPTPPQLRSQLPAAGSTPSLPRSIRRGAAREPHPAGRMAKMAPRRQERPPSTEARSCLPSTPVRSHLQCPSHCAPPKECSANHTSRSDAWPAGLLACLHACWLSCQHAVSSASHHACPPACLLYGWHDSLLSCWIACMLSSQPAAHIACHHASKCCRVGS